MTHEEIRNKNIQNVIQQAILIFAQNGVDNLNFTHLAKNVGLNVRSLYRYFESKDKLVEAVFRECSRNIFVNIAKIESSDEYQQFTGRQQILVIVKLILDLAREDSIKQHCLYQIEFYISSNRMEDGYYLVEEYDNIVAKALRKAFAKGVCDGTLNMKYQDKNEYTTLVVLLRGFVIHIAMVSQNEKMRLRYDINMVTEVFMNNLAQALSFESTDVYLDMRRGSV